MTKKQIIGFMQGSGIFATCGNSLVSSMIAGFCHVAGEQHGYKMDQGVHSHCGFFHNGLVYHCTQEMSGRKLIDGIMIQSVEQYVRKNYSDLKLLDVARLPGVNSLAWETMADKARAWARGKAYYNELQLAGNIWLILKFWLSSKEKRKMILLEKNPLDTSRGRVCSEFLYAILKLHYIGPILRIQINPGQVIPDDLYYGLVILAIWQRLI